MTARYTWGLFYFFLFAYRSAFSVVAQTWVAGLTTLGDTYSSFNVPSREITIAYLSNNRGVATDLTAALGGALTFLFGGNALIVNIAFQAIAFVGIVVFLRAAEVRHRIWLALFLMLPSFTIWSSIASKEAIVVFAMGIIGAYIIRLYRGDARVTFGLAFSFLLIWLFKPQYYPAILFLIVGTIVCSRVNKKAFVALAAGLVSFIPLYLFRDVIDFLALNLPRHFCTFCSADGTSSTRPAYWVDQYDVFFKAPYGMLQSFLGPTVAEASRGLLLAASFYESILMLGILVLYAIKQAFHLPVYMAVMSFFTLFWILFAVYPLGMMNPGTAIRYRTGYEILILVAVIVLLSRENFTGWRARSRAVAAQRG